MVRSRLICAATCACLLACGGGGGGGNDGAPPARSLVAVGWLGGGNEGWQTTGESVPGSGDGFLDDPAGLFVTHDGTIYVSDQDNERIVKWSADGTWLGWIGGGRDGWQTGENFPPVFDSTYVAGGAVAVSANGTVLVADLDHISRWSPDGEPGGWIGEHADGWQTGPTPEPGNVTSRFKYVGEMGVDENGNIYSAEGNRIVRWSSDGIRTGWLGGGTDGWKTAETVPPSTDELRSFRSVLGLALDGKGFLYATDDGNSRITKWTLDGVAVGWTGWGESGWRTSDERGQRRMGHSLDVAVDGTLYVAHGQFDKISRWSADGAYGGWFGDGSEGWTLEEGTDRFDRIRGERDFHTVSSVVAEPGGTIAVVDHGNARVSRWDRDGLFVGWIGGGQDGWRGGDAPDRRDAVNGFSLPWGMAKDSAGNLYVVDPDAERVSKWTADGTAVGWIGGGRAGWQTGPAPTLDGHYRTFRAPSGLFVEADGTIYVADSGNDRVSKWSADGVALGWIGEGWEGWRTERWEPRGKLVLGEGNRRAFSTPLDVAVDAEGQLVVADGGNHRVSRWSRDGKALGWLGGGRDGWRTDRGADRGGDRDEMWWPGGVGIDDAGRIIVADGRNSRISIWGPGGEAQGWLGGGEDGLHRDAARWADLEDHGRVSYEDGSTFRKFAGPTDVARAGGDLYVADSGNHRICIWSYRSRPLTARGWIGHGRDRWQSGRAPGASGGSGLRSFRSPTSIHVDDEGNLYVIDKNDRVVKWSPAPDTRETP